MELNKKNTKKIINIIIFTILFYWLVNNINVVMSIANRIFSLLKPFLLGAVLAFILNIPMSKIERFIKSKQKNNTSKLPIRNISIVLSLLLLVLFIAIIAFLLIPELINNIKLLMENIPIFAANIETWILKTVQEYPDLKMQVQDVLTNITDLNNIVMKALDYIINGSINFIGNIISGVVTFFTAIVFAIYMLNQKEYLLKGLKKILYAYLKEEQAMKIENVAKLASNTFSKFISGQCVEAVILGFIFFFVLSILQFPYTLIISVLISVTALIPMFGAMIAMCIGALLIAVTNPFQAVLFIVVFQVIQQIENNFIYPKVVGKSVGLSAIWTLLAVLLGGSLLGITGMIIGLPLASIIYAIIKDATNKKLSNKKINIE